MTLLRFSRAAVTLGVLLAIPTLARAQGVTPYNQPALSPWFGLYQKNGGPLDNYNMFVRPRFQLNNTLQRQQDAIQRNDTAISFLDQNMTRAQQKAAVRPTGAASVFMSTSHYYPSLQGNQRQWSAAGPASRTGSR